MKYYSEILDKVFNTAEELDTAEKEYKEKQATEKADKNAISKEKKVYADKIEAAEKKLEAVNKEYSLIQDKASEILEKANKEARELLYSAREKVKEAERQKRDAIIAFNKKFGVYTTSYTGQRAIDEFNHFVDRFTEPWFKIFKDFWF